MVCDCLIHEVEAMGSMVACWSLFEVTICLRLEVPIVRFCFSLCQVLFLAGFFFFFVCVCVYLPGLDSSYDFGGVFMVDFERTQSICPNWVPYRKENEGKGNFLSIFLFHLCGVCTVY